MRNKKWTEIVLQKFSYFSCCNIEMRCMHHDRSLSWTEENVLLPSFDCKQLKFNTLRNTGFITGECDLFKIVFSQKVYNNRIIATENKYRWSQLSWTHWDSYTVVSLIDTLKPKICMSKYTCVWQACTAAWFHLVVW